MLIVTHSSIDTFRTCHQLYFYKYDKLLKPEKKSWALIDGEAFDKGLDYLYSGRTSPGGANKREWPLCNECRRKNATKA